MGRLSHAICPRLCSRRQGERGPSCYSLPQFCTGCIMIFTHFYLHYFGPGCGSNVLTGWSSLAINCSFLVLFAQFFKQSYGKKKR